MRRRNVVISLVIVLVLIVGAVVVYPYLTANKNPLANNQFLKKGSVSYDAFGGEAYIPVSLSKSYRLTGGFDTNTSAVFYVMTSQELASQNTLPSNQVSYYYSTGIVKGADINTTIVSGDYDLVFDFVNSTMTALTITQTFILTPLS